MQAALKIYHPQYVESRLKYNLHLVIKRGRKSLEPPPDITVSEWADQNRMLPETSAEPGQYKTDRLPYARLIMDKVTDPRVRQITIMGSSQIGKTEIMNNIIGYHIDLKPCSIIVMQPTDKDARDYSSQKLEPMIEDTRCLRNKVAKKNKSEGESAVLRKKYIGGYLAIVSGKTTSSTRQRAAKLTVADDIDGIEIGHTREGDPVLRLIKRSTTYPDHLNINISTPTVEDSSRIHTLYTQSNMMKFYVRCKYCGTQQILKPEQITWDKDTDAFGKVTEEYPATAKLACQGCGVLLTEGERQEILKGGEWIADRPEIKDHFGFWINEISSPVSSLEKIARAIIYAGDDTDKLEALTNTVFGLPYKKIQGESVDPLHLIERREDYINIENPKIPNNVLLLTLGLDVQAGSGEKPARLEFEVWGWGLDEESWIIDKQVIPGTITDVNTSDGPWHKLRIYLTTKKFIREDGIELRIVRQHYDSGYESQSVYDVTRGRFQEGIYACKGSNKYGAPLIPRTISFVGGTPKHKNRVRQSIKKKTPLISIGTQAAKAELFGRLQNIKEPGSKYVHFTKAFCDVDYFNQLTSEHAVLKTTGLVQYIVYELKKRGTSNEALDIWILNYTAMKASNPNFERIKANIDKFKNDNVDSESTSEGEIKPAENPEIKKQPIRRIQRPQTGWSVKI